MAVVRRQEAGRLTERPAISEFAVLLVARHPHFADFVDLYDANAQAELLRANGLDALNAKALRSPATEVLDVITEHNAAAALVRRGFSDIQLEPPAMSRPVDLVGTHGGRCYRIEVKRLAASEHDELHATVMQTLNRALESDTGSIAIEMNLRESFEAADTNALVRHVKQALRDASMERIYTFAPEEDQVVASYKFHPSARRSHPYVAILGDLGGELRDVTGVDASRVRDKLKRAYDKFKVCPADDAVHLVALEVDHTIAFAHVAEALYGREYVTFTRHQGYAGSGRDVGGAFFRGLHSRLGGLVVALRAERHRLFSAYTFTLFVNPTSTLPVPDVVAALGADRVFGPDDFP